MFVSSREDAGSICSRLLLNKLKMNQNTQNSSGTEQPTYKTDNNRQLDRTKHRD